MTLLRAVAAYGVGLHLLAAIPLAILLWDGQREWILALEAALVLSLLLGCFLLGKLKMPHELVEIGTRWMKEGDFQHSFHPSGTRDLKELIRLYNDLVARLRGERLRQQEQEVFLEKLLAASPSGIITADHDGRIAMINPAARQLLRLDEQQARSLLRASDNALLRQLAGVPVGESRVLGERWPKRLKCSHSRFFDRGHPRSFFLIEDLTHELWVNEKLAYNALVRTMSHEVNNTLGATSSILHSALEYGEQLSSEDHQDFDNALRVAIERTDHLAAFMHRYAEVVRVPAPVLQEVELPRVLTRIARLMEPECQRRQVRLEIDFDEGVPAVAMDMVQMEQVFVNVIRNALEAIEREGWIRIRIAAGNRAPWVEIADSGPGLSPEVEANLLTPFFSTKAQGQGVGLTLTREILSLHGFGFSLESPPDSGARFRIEMNPGKATAPGPRPS